MNPLRAFCLVAILVAVASSTPTQNKMNSDNKRNSARNDNSDGNSLKPSDWLSASSLESLPSLDEVTLQQLENMSVKEGQKLMEKLYHLSQLDHSLAPTFVPSPSNIPAHIFKSNGEKTRTNLNELVQKLKQEKNFGNDEVTIFMTGVPQQSPSISKATKSIVQAYMQRYYGQQQVRNQNYDYENAKHGSTSSEEDYSESWKNQKSNSGDLIIIDLGSALTNFKRLAMLDVEQTGNMIGKALVQLTNEADVPQETIHIVAQGIAAHVAGAAGRQYTRMTGHQLRRITALDPSKIFAKNPKVLTGLARGDADFVDAIHTSTCGMGTSKRVGDIDFYVNGPASELPGTNNIVEASMRATRFFAESVRPGNERNFPAVAANSLQQYNNKNGNGKRTYMGINAQFDSEGDYILEVNSKSPFGKSTPAQKQNTYHGVHQSWKSSNDQDNE